MRSQFCHSEWPAESQRGAKREGARVEWRVDRWAGVRGEGGDGGALMAEMTFSTRLRMC